MLIIFLKDSVALGKTYSKPTKNFLFLLMRKFIFFFFLLSPFILKAQIATEADIPFTLNSDIDDDINVIDTDDDEDGVLDNDDFRPLDAAQSAPITSAILVTTSADAGLRSNSSGAQSNNYGSDATIQTRNSQRTMILKFAVPAGITTKSATFTLYTNTEKDPLEVYLVDNTSWIESTVTFNNFNAGVPQLLGTTAAPVGGAYTFSIPVAELPAAGSDFTLMVFDPNDPNGTIEELFTKETAGKAATINFEYDEVDAPRVVVDQSTGTSAFVNGGPFQASFTLSQAPTDVVYVPFAISNPGVANIAGDQVLTFTPANWNIPQTLNINPASVGTFDIQVRPLHSNDVFFNGINPPDLLGYIVRATDITNLQSSYTVQTGQTLSVDLTALSSNGSTTFDYQLLEGPSGLGIVENSGHLSFRPLSSQIGTHPVKFQVTDAAGTVSVFETSVTVTDGGVADPAGYIVDLNAPADPAADGSAAHPYNDIAVAVNAAALTGGDVLIRGGEFQLANIITITAAATNPVTIKPMDGERVKINYDLRAAFEFTGTSSNITLEGIEIDGNTDEIDFWCIVGQAFWGDETIPRGGGIAINLDGQDITIRNNYIHDSYQKAVEIRDARYAVVEGNIIHNIATTSLSGGHGIMRQQKGKEFTDDDIAGKYRWDIRENTIFNVEQRIYSWVPSKGFIEMTLDEGKPILIDDPQDTDGNQEFMTARITNNVVAFGAIDNIRLKSTPNLEVSNNAIYSEKPHADGITDKGGDSPTPQFTNFIFTNNAAQTAPGTISLEVDDAISQANAAPGSPTVSGNIAAVGAVKPADPGITVNPTTQLFVDPENGDFHINPSLGLPASLGVDTIVLAEMDARIAAFGVSFKKDDFVSDNLKLSQSILDNIPGINDGIAGNESVFTNIGVMTADRSEIDFSVVNGVWKTNTGSPDTMQFRLNDEYVDWYIDTETNYKNALGNNYERIRYGTSVLKQDQVFDADWLTVSKITPTETALIEGVNQNIVLDGDLLVDFEGVSPAIGQSYDLVVAKNLSTANATDLFDRVLFKGFTPADYTLQIVTLPNGLQAARLTITGANPNDTDGDGISNADEALIGTDPNLAETTPGVPDATLDFDGDGISNADESDETLAVPTDTNPADGLNDIVTAMGFVRGTVWQDNTDDNALQKEAGVGGVNISLLDATGTTTLFSTSTLADGTYAFNNIPAGNYIIRIGTTTVPLVYDNDDLIDGANDSEENNQLSGGTTNNVIDGDIPVSILSGGPETDSGNDFIISQYIVADPLPVNIISFTGTSTSAGSLLAWKTSTELNNRGFSVMHSIDLQHFVSLGFVDGQGTSAEYVDYTFMHPTPVYGVNYYQLWQYDYSSNTPDKSQIVAVTNTQESDIILTYPNPTTDAFKIKGWKPEDELKIYDLQGKLLKEETNQLDIQSTVDVKNLPAGTYIIVLERAGLQIHQFKLLKN